MLLRRLVLIALVLLAHSGCNRNMEPYVPGEQPKEPDLSRIFPAGAEVEEAPVTAMPAAPGEAPAPTPARPTPAQRAPAQPAPAQPIEGTIEIAPELADRVPSGATLFLVARTGAAGPPTAVVRVESPSFPYEFSLGPEHRMIKAMPFVGPLSLTARLDVDGNARTQTPGDLQGRYPDPVDPGAKSLRLTLDEAI